MYGQKIIEYLINDVTSAIQYFYYHKLLHEHIITDSNQIEIIK